MHCFEVKEVINNILDLKTINIINSISLANIDYQYFGLNEDDVEAILTYRLSKGVFNRVMRDNDYKHIDDVLYQIIITQFNRSNFPIEALAAIEAQRNTLMNELFTLDEIPNEEAFFLNLINRAQNFQVIHNAHETSSNITSTLVGYMPPINEVFEQELNELSIAGNIHNPADSY